MTSFVYSMAQQQRDSLNSSLKSLNNMVDSQTYKSTTQNFTEILYSGKKENLTSATINYPRTIGNNIPVIGYVASKPYIVGYTDGNTFAPNMPTIEKYTTTHTDQTYEEVESMGIETTTTSNDDRVLGDGTIYKSTTTTHIWYEEGGSSSDDSSEDTDTYYKYTAVSTTVEIDYSNTDVVIIQRM